MRCGELCRSCKSKCNEVYNETAVAEIECPVCSGADGGCEHCGNNGFFKLTECPNQFVGKEMIDAVNMANWALKGQWPVDGGILDQSNWFVELTQRIQSDQIEIENTRREASR